MPDPNGPGPGEKNEIRSKSRQLVSDKDDVVVDSIADLFTFITKTSRLGTRKTWASSL